jgi:hypothetical protein
MLIRNAITWAVRILVEAGVSIHDNNYDIELLDFHWELTCT